MNIFVKTDSESTSKLQNLQKAIKLLSIRLEEIPEEFRGNATLEIDHENYEFYTEFMRPETEADIKEREESNARWLIDTERRDREKYESLKAKYGW